MITDTFSVNVCTVLKKILTEYIIICKLFIDNRFKFVHLKRKWRETLKETKC